MESLRKMIEISAEQQIRFMHDITDKLKAVGPVLGAVHVGVPTTAGAAAAASTEGDGSAAWDAWAGKKLGGSGGDAGASGAGAGGVGGAGTFGGTTIHVGADQALMNLTAPWPTVTR